MALSPIMVALALQSASVVPPAPLVQEEIVVIGQKLKTWRAQAKFRNGRSRCVTKASTGDKAVDAIGCTALVTCFTQLHPRLVDSADKRRSPAVRKEMNAAIARDMTTCVSAQRETLIAELAERRYQARRGQ
jgi:hypothetical protein